MKTVVITGGIATGKSTVCRMVRDEVGETEFFDCDAVVHELLTSESIKDKLVAEFGNQILSPEGEVDRVLLGEIVFADVAERRLLERILHPHVLQRCVDAKRDAGKRGDAAPPLFMVDVPLYYQVDFPVEPDEVWVVAASYETQRERLEARSSVAADRADWLISAQMPVETKASLADRVIWNDGNEDQLKQQVRLAINSLNLNHG